MDSVYAEYWQEKKWRRSQCDTPITPLENIMHSLGLPVDWLQENTQLLHAQLPYNTSPEELATYKPISPGALIQAVLDDLQITQSELAQQMGVTRTYIHLWIHSRRTLSVENAISIEQHLDIPAHILLRLQADYQLFAARHHQLATDPVPRHSTL